MPTLEISSAYTTNPVVTHQHTRALVNSSPQNNSIPPVQKTTDSESDTKSKSSTKADSSSTTESDSEESSKSNGQLTAEEKAIAQALAKRDREVRAHEAAHMAAGGELTGAASFTYEVGPDGIRYAVSGEVSIDTSPVRGDPAATLAKAVRIQAAALAPAQPSNADRAVASAAAAMAASARAQMMRERLSDDEDAPNKPSEEVSARNSKASPLDAPSASSEPENKSSNEGQPANSPAIDVYQQTIANPTGAPDISSTINIVA